MVFWSAVNGLLKASCRVIEKRSRSQTGHKRNQVYYVDFLSIIELLVRFRHLAIDYFTMRYVKIQGLTPFMVFWSLVLGR